MSDTDFKDAIEVAKEAVRKAGQAARSRLNDPGYLKWTGRRDVETGSAVEIQDTLVGRLSNQFPEAGILSRLGPEDTPIEVNAPDLWILDPASGSLNFAHGVPQFAISVALRSQGDIGLGVVYDPCRDELFEAVRRGTPRLNGQTIAVRRILEGQEAWNSAFIGTDWPQDAPLRARTQMILGMMENQVLQCNLMGSPALGMCYVASGRLHLYWHLGMALWEVAAAALILEQAGGILTDQEGLSWLHSDGGYIASNNVIHGWALNCIRNATSSDQPDPRHPAPLPKGK